MSKSTGKKKTKISGISNDENRCMAIMTCKFDVRRINTTILYQAKQSRCNTHTHRYTSTLTFIKFPSD